MTAFFLGHGGKGHQAPFSSITDTLKFCKKKNGLLVGPQFKSSTCMKSFFIIKIFLSVLCSASTGYAQEARSWRNADGKTILAKLVEVEGLNLTIEKENKRDILPIASFSQGDQDEVKKWVSEKKEDKSSSAGLEISKKGKLLYKTSFKNTEGWRVSSGDWKCENNTISGTQKVGKGHKAHIVIKRPKPVNTIITCEVYLGDSSSLEFTIDDAPRKLGRIGLTPKSFKGIQTHRMKKSPIKKKFNVIKDNFETDQWHEIKIEMMGNQIVAQLGKHSTRSIDNVWDKKTKRLGLLVSNGPAKFRNLKIWEALPKD